MARRIAIMTFGETIREARKKQRFTIVNIVEKMGSGISPSYITSIELYGQLPSASTILDLAKALGLNGKKLMALAKKEHYAVLKKRLDKKFVV